MRKRKVKSNKTKSERKVFTKYELIFLLIAHTIHIECATNEVNRKIYFTFDCRIKVHKQQLCVIDVYVYACVRVYARVRIYLIVFSFSLRCFFFVLIQIL